MDDASYGWRSPEDGLYLFSMTSDGDDVSIAVVDDACADIELGPCSTSINGSSVGIAVPVAFGAEVAVILDARSRVGTYALSIHQECPNQDLGSALGSDLVTGTTVDARGGLTAATCMAGTRDAGEGEDMAFGWTAPAAGRYAWTVAAPAFDPHLYVLDTMCDGPEIACVVGSAGSARVEMMLAAGQTVLLVVDGARGDGGSFALSVEAL